MRLLGLPLLMATLAVGASADELPEIAIDFGRFPPLVLPQEAPMDREFPGGHDEVMLLRAGHRSLVIPLDVLGFHHVVEVELDKQRVAATWCSMTRTAATYRLGEDHPGLEARALRGGGLVLGVVGDDEAFAQLAFSAPLQAGPRPIITTWAKAFDLDDAAWFVVADPEFEHRYVPYRSARHRAPDESPSWPTSIIVDHRLPPSLEVLVIATDNGPVVITAQEVRRAGRIDFNYGGEPTWVRWSKMLDAPIVRQQTPFRGGYWAALSAVHPNALVSGAGVQEE